MWSAFIWIWWSYSWQTATGRVPGPSAPGVNGACLDWKLPEPWHPHSEPSGETCGYSASCWGLGTVSCIFQPIFFTFLPRVAVFTLRAVDMWAYRLPPRATRMQSGQGSTWFKRSPLQARPKGWATHTSSPPCSSSLGLSPSTPSFGSTSKKWVLPNPVLLKIFSSSVFLNDKVIYNSDNVLLKTPLLLL